MDELTKLRDENGELKKRESVYITRLNTIEQRNRDLELKLEESSITAQAASRRTSLLDPAVNQEFRRLQQELAAVRGQLKKTQEELDSVRFSPTSSWGHRLVAKCKVLQDENQEFGKVLSEGTVRWLESELARERAVSEQLRQERHASEETIRQLTVEIEAAQSALAILRRQLSHDLAPAMPSSTMGHPPEQQLNPEPAQQDHRSLSPQS